MMRNKDLHPGLSACFSILCLLLTAAATGPVRAQTTANGSLSIGYDSFIDRFTILEDDTTDTVQEIYLSLDNSLNLKKKSLRLAFHNAFRMGNQTLGDNLFSSLTAGSGSSTVLELRNQTMYRHYLAGSDYEFGNDYTQSNTSLRISRYLADDFRVAARGRLESTDYSQRTDFDYDYRYADGGLELEAGSYFGKFVRIAAAAGHREAPDTTALNYDRFLADLELHMVPAGGCLLEISVAGDRRSYAVSVERSIWNVYSQAGLTLDSGNATRYSLRLESELYLYDKPSTTFFDTHFIRGGVRISSVALGRLTVFGEPRFAAMLCDAYEEERYEEGSIVLGLELLGGTDYWLSFSWEPGRRNYIMEENEIYSDFYLNRFSLIGNVTAASGLSFDLFVMHDPERHSRRDDDFSMTMVSAAVTKRF